MPPGRRGLWRGFEQGEFLFDDQFDRGVVGVGLAVETVAYVDQLFAVALEQCLGAGFSGLEGFDNFHIVPGDVGIARQSAPVPAICSSRQRGEALPLGELVAQFR